MNGSYPFLFDFPKLKILNLSNIQNLRWDLGMVSGLPSLKHLVCPKNYKLTGNTNSLRMLRNTLQRLELSGCTNVEGDLMDLADFPLLEEIIMSGTKINADTSQISPKDFLSISRIILAGDRFDGKKWERKLNSIEEAAGFYLARYPILKAHGQKNTTMGIRVTALSKDSPDYYESTYDRSPYAPPLKAQFVEAGPRIGWRWLNYHPESLPGNFKEIACEINWLDPEPTPADDGYKSYLAAIQELRKDVDFFRGYLSPPTKEEHEKMCQGLPEPSPDSECVIT